MTKQDLIEIVYTPAQRSQIDVAIPNGSVEAGQTRFFVMDYTESSMGKLVDLRERAKSMGYEGVHGNHFYVLMTQDGKISNRDLTKIQSALNNDMARKNLGRALEYGRKALDKAHIHALEYGNITMWCVKSWDTTARNTRLKVFFENDEVYNLDGYTKLSYLREAAHNL